MSSGLKVSQGNLYVVSAPSGTGKGRIISTYLEENRGNLEFSISCTTRPPRPDDFGNYIYKSPEEFARMRHNEELLECDPAANDEWYGTPKKPVMEKLNMGKDVLLEINYRGAFQVKQNFPQAKLIFVLPPSRDELLFRLVTRGKLPVEKIISRFESSPTEIKNAKEFDYIILNNKLPDAVSDFKAIVDWHRNPDALTEVERTAVERCKKGSGAYQNLIDELINTIYDRQGLVNMINVLSDNRDRGIQKTL